ncbi:hypothetical protein BCA37_24560 [Mycobacterium sp. djl-10]|nr:hypothetical protein BCA37_24560 [Mycobacterium sp. djl-10]
MSQESTNPVVQKMLWAGTGFLGLAAWAVCLAEVTPSDLVATLAVLAGAVAVTGLLPGQQVRGWFAVAVAVAAFAAAITATVNAGGAGWFLIAADALVALQVVVAVGALLLEPREAAVPEDQYAAYARYVRAYQDYAQGYGSHRAAEHSVEVPVDDHATATAHSDHEAWATYTRHIPASAPSSSESTTGHHAEGGVAGSPGLPNVAPGDRTHRVPGRAAQNAAPSAPGAW